MHGATYLAVAIPVPIFILGSATALLVSLSPSMDSLRSYMKTFLACQLSIMIFRLSLTIRRSFIGYSSTKGRLPEISNLNPIDKFILPITEELLKLVLLTLSVIFFSRQNAWSHVVLVACTFTLNKLVCNYVTYNPSNYKTRFKSFTRLYNKYMEHLQCNSRQKSVSSTSSNSIKDTLASVSSSEDSESLNEKPIFHTVSFDSPKKSTTPIDLCTNNNMAHHEMIDRLYSVSPRDTLHLVYETSHSSQEGSSLLAKTISNYSSISQLQDSSQMGDNGVAHFADFADEADIQPFPIAEEPKSSTPHQWRNWFSWLLPLERSVPSVPQSTKSAIIKKKLSTFTLNSEYSSAKSIRSRQSFGSFDFENQAYHTHKNVANSHTFRDFAAFANKFLDFWSPNLAGILHVLDPAFIKFGVPLDKLPSFLFTLHLLNMGIWQYDSIFLLAYPLLSKERSYESFMLIIPSIAVIKLFSVNYLHCQCTLSYQHSIIIEFFVNSILAFVIGSLYFY